MLVFTCRRLRELPAVRASERTRDADGRHPDLFHHTLLTYIGYRIWRDHPVVGAGWQASTDPDVVDPQLPAARKKFPDVAPLAFPTREHEWGVQNAYIQASRPTSA